MLETIFRLPINQGIGTKTRTSQNEAFNRLKLVYLDKRIDYWKSYPVRHALAILHNNEGICEMKNKREDLETFDWSQVIYKIIIIIKCSYIYLHEYFIYFNN